MNLSFSNSNAQSLGVGIKVSECEPDKLLVDNWLMNQLRKDREAMKRLEVEVTSQYLEIDSLKLKLHYSDKFMNISDDLVSKYDARLDIKDEKIEVKTDLLYSYMHELTSSEKAIEALKKDLNKAKLRNWIYGGTALVSVATIVVYGIIQANK